MARKVVAERGDGWFLVALNDPEKPETARGVVVHNGAVVGDVLALQSILARGYWETFTGSAKEAAAILAHVPATLTP